MKDYIEQAIEIAKTGTAQQKRDYVEWCCFAIQFHSANYFNNEESQKALSAIKEAYNAYLNALTKEV